MPRRDDPKSSRPGKSGDAFQKITGIGPALERRLWSAGILSYDDLARRSPEEIAAALNDVTGMSSERVTSQNWTGQARDLAGSPAEAPVPRQHYAAFHLEFLLESDNRVRRTRVRDHQTDARDAWPGWDEERLLSFLRDRIPLPAAATAEGVPSPEPDREQSPEQAPAGTGPADTGPPPPYAPEAAPSLYVAIEELDPIREGQRGYRQNPGEPIPVRLVLRLSLVGTSSYDTFDFSAAIAARAFGSHDRLPLGTARGVIRINDPVSVRVDGTALPAGLYRLVATVDIYPAGHSPRQSPLHSHGASGGLIGIADDPPESVASVA